MGFPKAPTPEQRELLLEGICPQCKQKMPRMNFQREYGGTWLFGFQHHGWRVYINEDGEKVIEHFRVRA